MGEQCLFCNQPAARFCDRAIGMVWAGDTEKFRGQAAYKITTMDAMLAHDYRCSAPCCATHAHVVGFICGKDADTIDHCEGCHRAEWGPVGLATPAEIEARRRHLHAAYRRQRIAIVTESEQLAE